MPRRFFRVLALLTIAIALAGSYAPSGARGDNTSWLVPGNFINYSVSYSYSVSGYSASAQAGTYNVSMRVLSVSSNSAQVILWTNQTSYLSFGGVNTTTTLYTNQPFPSQSGQFGLFTPLYCPPENVSVCTDQVSSEWVGYLPTLFVYGPGSSHPTSTVQDSNDQTVIGSIKTKALSVQQSWSYSPGGSYYGSLTLSGRSSEKASYDSVLGLLSSSTASVSETYNYGGYSSSIQVNPQTRITKTNIGFTAGTGASSAGTTVPWFLFGLLAIVAVAVLLAVTALRRRGRPPAATTIASSPQVTAEPQVAFSKDALPLFCGKCGAKNRTESAFCTKCGSPMK